MFAGRETLVAAHDSLRMNGPSWRDCGTRELEFSGLLDPLCLALMKEGLFFL